MTLPIRRRTPHRRTPNRFVARLAVALSIAGLLPVPPAAAEPTAVPGTGGDSPEPGAASQSLRPGDAIDLLFWRDETLSGRYAVDETGLAILPLLGDRSVLNAPPADLKAQLLRDYAEFVRNQEVRVTFLRRIRLLGEVRNPGLYHVDPTMGVADAVALAGGATEEGDLSKVELFRNDFRVVSNLREDRLAQVDLLSGDQIYVSRRSWLSRNGEFVVGALLSTVGIVVAFTR